MTPQQPGPDSSARRAAGGSGSGVQTPGATVVYTAGDTAADRPAPAVPPELAGHAEYDVVRELGRGGMGVVYLVRNKRMFGREEVLKVAAPDQKARTEAAVRFRKEMWASAQLSHDNVVRAYNTIDEGTLLALSMEFAGTQDLARLVKEGGPLTPARACRLIAQAAQGLQAAHEKGMVHRDIKPSNLMLGVQGKREVVKILDFGLVKAAYGPAAADPAAEWAAGGDLNLTGAGRVLGTPDYIAPEQTKNASTVDIRADVYSLGCTLYFLLAGWPPYRPTAGPAVSLESLILAHHLDTPAPIHEVRPEVPAGLAAVVAKMMAKEPSDRYATPDEAFRALLPFTKSLPAPVPVESKPKPAPASGPDLPPAPPPAAVGPPGVEPAVPDPPVRRRPKWLVPAAISLFAAPFAVVLGVLSVTREQPEPTTAAVAVLTPVPTAPSPLIPKEEPPENQEPAPPATKPAEPPPPTVPSPRPTPKKTPVPKPSPPVALPPKTPPTKPTPLPAPTFQELVLTPGNRAGWELTGNTNTQPGLVLKPNAEMLSRDDFLIEGLVVSGEVAATKDAVAFVGIHLFPQAKVNPRVTGWEARWDGITAAIKPQSVSAVRLVDPGRAFTLKPSSRVGGYAGDFLVLAKQPYKFEYSWTAGDQRGMFFIRSRLPAGGAAKDITNLFAYKVNNSDAGGRVGLFVTAGEVTVTRLSVRGKPARP